MEREIEENNLLCRKCEKEMKKVPQGFDAMTMFNEVEMLYCDNPKCELCGFVVVMGINLKEKKSGHKQL